MDRNKPAVEKQVSDTLVSDTQVLAGEKPGSDTALRAVSDPKTDTQILVSVVIPSYNHERYLTACMDSVLNQEGVNLELVVVDDGSRDGSWQLIEQAAARDARVRPFRQQNQGAHAAINAGLRACRGEFLAILNSDDLFHPTRLRTLVALANQGPGLDFISTGLRLIDGESQVQAEHPWLQEYQRMRDTARAQGAWAALLERNFTVSTSNFFMRRSLYQALGPIRPLRYTMDWDYALRACRHSPARFAWRDDLVLLDYRLHGSNTILGGLPVSAIEANHLILRSMRQAYHVPPAALAGLRRHYKLVRQQQVAKVAAARDAVWEKDLHKAHEGWQKTSENYQNALNAYNQLHTDLGNALARLQVAEQRLNTVLDSRSLALGHTLLAPVRWLRALKARLQGRPVAPAPHPRVALRPPAQPLTLVSPMRWENGALVALSPEEAAAHAGRPPAPCAVALALPSAPSPSPSNLALPRVAVHVHLHYTELLDELLQAVGKLPPPFDLFVTCTQPVDAIAPAVHARFAQAVVEQCENRGRDIGPFIRTLHRHGLNQYDLVLKLHSKQSRNDPNYLKAIQQLFGPDIRGGDDWRQGLVQAVAGSTERVRAIYAAFAADPALGMVGAERFLCRAPDADAQGYAALCERLGVSSEVLFFAGTMFWVRGRALTRLRDTLTFDDFAPEGAGARAGARVEAMLEHHCERVFGAVVAADGGVLGTVPVLQPGRAPA